MILTPSKKEKRISAFKYMGMFKVPGDGPSCYDKRSENDYLSLMKTQKERRRKK